MGTMAVKHWFKINNLNFPLAMRGCCSRRARTPCLFRGGGGSGGKGEERGTKKEKQKELGERGRKGQRREGGRKEEKREKEDGRKCFSTMQFFEG